MLDLDHLTAVWTQYGGERYTPPAAFSVGDLEIGRTPRIMGVVNLSPQSWYRESVCLSPAAAIQRAIVLAAQGADIIDLGGESTLAHADRVDSKAQIELLTPIVRELSDRNILVSVETYSAPVAEAVLNAGAKIINMTGTAQSQEIYGLAAGAQAGVIVSYVQGTHVRDVDDLKFDTDPFEHFTRYFRNEWTRAESQSLDRIIFDPGLGFYYRNLTDGPTRVHYQMETLLQTFRLHALGQPICHALPHAFEFFETEVRSAEPFFAVLAALGKTDLFRTHEVPRIRAVLDTLQSSPNVSPPSEAPPIQRNR